MNLYPEYRYFKYIQFDKENADNPIENGTEDMTRYSIKKKNTQMANKHIKRHHLYLIHLKPKMQYCHIHIRVANIQKKIPNVVRRWTNQNIHTLLVQAEIDTISLEN